MAVVAGFHREESYTKKIEAVIKPDMFSAIKVALANADYPSITAHSARGK